jgi:hypothetical protein
MGRKYEPKPNFYVWNLEQCEEIVLIDAYIEACQYVPASEPWKQEFDNHFFQHGNGVAFSFIDQINAVRRRRASPPIQFVETDVFDYGRSPEKTMKSETRKRLLQELRDAPTDERIRRVNRAKGEVEMLPAPHQTWEQYKERNSQYIRENTESWEQVRRRKALEAASAPPTPPTPQKPPSLPAQKAITLLKHVTSEAVIDRIIEKLSPEDVLSMLPEIENKEIADRLILHSLSEY